MNFNILKKNRDKTAKVEGSKKKYYSHLSGTTSDDKRTLKAYSTILKTFLNDNNLPWIPPLLYMGKFIIDFKKKPNSLMTSWLRNATL